MSKLKKVAIILLLSVYVIAGIIVFLINCITKISIIPSLILATTVLITFIMIGLDKHEGGKDS